MAKFMYGTLWYLQTLHVNVGEGKIMVLNTTFNNMSAISWQSVLSVGETGISNEFHRPVASQWLTLSHNVYRVHLALDGFEVTVVVVIECIDSCKSIYHTIMPTAAPAMHVYIYFHIYTWFHPRVFRRIRVAQSLVFYVMLCVFGPGEVVPSLGVRRLLSVVCRLSSVNLSHFKLLLWNHWADWNQT